jgi:hypothetical protein
MMKIDSANKTTQAQLLVGRFLYHCRYRAAEMPEGVPATVSTRSKVGVGIKLVIREAHEIEC